MQIKKLALLVILGGCLISFAGEAHARGGMGRGQGGGIRLQKRDGSCIKNSVANKTQTRQQLRQGSDAAESGAGQMGGDGAMRRLGPGDGTGNSTRPMDGTGYGSPAR